MESLEASKRTYTNVLTGETFRMFTNVTQTRLILINEITKERLYNFIIAAFTPTEFRLKDKTVVYLSNGEFMPLQLDNPATHRRFKLDGCKFQKIK